MKSKSKRRKGLKAKKYNLGGYLNPTDPPRTESRASAPPQDYTPREYDTGVDDRGPFVIIGGEKLYGEQPLQQVYNPFSPAQDARDIASGVMKFPQSPTEGLTDIALGAIGAVPILGDIAKGALKPILRTPNRLMYDYASRGGTPLDIFSRDVVNQDVIGVYTDQARKVTKELFDEQADRLIKRYESRPSIAEPKAPYSSSSWFIDDFQVATKPLTEAEISALKKDIDIANSGDGYVNVSTGRRQGYNNDFDMIPADVLSDRLEAVGKSDEWYLDPVLAKYFGSDWNATDALQETFEGKLNNQRSVILEAIHGTTSSTPTILNHKDLRNTALAFGGLGTAAAGGYAYANTPQAYRNAVRRKLGLPQDLPALASTEEKYVDLSNRRLGYAETVPGQTPDIEANLILGGEFVEGSENSDTVKDAIDYKNTQGSVKLPSIGGEIDFDAQSGDYYGVQDGKLVVGGINSFRDDTKVVPLRYSPKNISEARVENGRFRIVDQSGKPIYQNITSAGKIILYSPETGKSAFFYSSSPEKSVEFTNRFLSENNGSAIPVVIDNGRYQYYMDTKDQGTMSGADYGDYIKNDVNRPYRHGYNITAYDKGGRLKVLKRGKKGALSSLVKNYNLGGYLDPNGDPTKKPGQAVAESTAIPNYTEQAFLNYAGLLPQLQTPFFRDEGTIRPTPENEPNVLDLIWEGTPLGMTEGERLAPPDQMSLIDVMAEPLKALEYYSFDSNRGRLPTRAEWDAFGSPNPMDNALFMYNPAAQISFAQEDEAGGLSAITGIGKYADVIKNAFNTGDDVLKIAAENISKQGKKITQQKLFRDINNSPINDVITSMETPYPGVADLQAPPFSFSNRPYEHFEGSIANLLRDQHSNEYGIIPDFEGQRFYTESPHSADKIDVVERSQGIVGNINTIGTGMDLSQNRDGIMLPMTRAYTIMEDGSKRPLIAQGQASTSIPQIRPLQRGGELEKFVGRDGMLNMPQLKNFIETSKSLNDADRFVLSRTLGEFSEDQLKSNNQVSYNEFKQVAGLYVPRMGAALHESTGQYDDYGVTNIFGEGARERSQSIGVALFDEPSPRQILPGDPRDPKMKTYLLDSPNGGHYPEKPIYEDAFGRSYVGNHSHYRVTRLDAEPKTSYFLELQSDALKPRTGDSRYGIMANESNETIETIKEGFPYPKDQGEFYFAEIPDADKVSTTLYTDDQTGMLSSINLSNRRRNDFGDATIVRTNNDVLTRMNVGGNPDIYLEDLLYNAMAENYVSDPSAEVPNWAKNLVSIVKDDITFQRELGNSGASAYARMGIYKEINKMKPNDFLDMVDNYLIPESIAYFDEPIYNLGDDLEDIGVFIGDAVKKHNDYFNSSKTGDPQGMDYSEVSNAYKRVVDMIDPILYNMASIYGTAQHIAIRYEGIKSAIYQIDDQTRRAVDMVKKYHLQNVDASPEVQEVIDRINVDLNSLRNLGRDLQNNEVMPLRSIMDATKQVEKLTERFSNNALPAPINPRDLTEGIEYGDRNWTPSEALSRLQTDLMEKGYDLGGYFVGAEPPKLSGLGAELDGSVSDVLSDKSRDLKMNFIKYQMINKRINKSLEELNKLIGGFDHLNIKNPVSDLMMKNPMKRVAAEALHGPYSNIYNRFPTAETSRRIQGHGIDEYPMLHRQYDNLPKIFKKLGFESKKVEDEYGNTWWEVKGTPATLNGTAEYDAYFKGGRIGLKKKRNRKMRSVKC